jgi:hypothetical protein
MKPLSIIFLLALAVTIISTTPLNAQTSVIEVKIPYAFTVENTTLSAGEYTIAALTENTVVIRPKAGPGAVVTLTTAAGTAKAVNPQLVFHRYGDQYFLAEVWLVRNTEGRAFYASSHEIELARNVRQEQVVQLAKK